MKSIIAQRREKNAVCPKCKSPDYEYKGRVGGDFNGKHQFTCKSCGNTWQYGKTESIFTKLK